MKGRHHEACSVMLLFEILAIFFISQRRLEQTAEANNYRPARVCLPISLWQSDMFDDIST